MGLKSSRLIIKRKEKRFKRGGARRCQPGLLKTGVGLVGLAIGLSAINAVSN